MLEESWPAYSYVPGGPWPHPISGPGGHSFGRRERSVAPILDEDWSQSPDYLRGVDLFNHGFYWEAHEAWESLWHAHERRGPTADLLKALIKLAAAGVKVREDQPNGVRTHARRAAELLGGVERIVGPSHLGLNLGRLAEIANSLAERPPTVTSERDVAVKVVFGFRLEPERITPLSWFEAD